MALSFQPPTDLVNAYLNRPSPGQEAQSGIQQAFQTYVQQKALQQQKDLTQEQRDIELAKGVSAGGQDFQSALDKIKAGRQAPQTMPTGQGPSLIDRAKAFFGAAPVGKNPSLDQGTPPPPIVSTGTVSGQPSTVSPTTDPLVQEYQKDPLAFKTQHGTQGMDKLKTQVEIDKALQDKSKGPLKTVTKKGALAKGVFDPSKEIVMDPSQENQGETKQERLGASLRKELTTSKPYQNLTMAKTAADNIAQAAKDPGAYGDLATLFDYMKALDPTSVVREGEQDTFRKTGSFTQSMANSMNKLVNGQSITPEQRQEIVKYTRNRLRTSHNVYKNHAEPTLRQAKRIGADPMEVDPFYGQDFEHLIGADEPAAPKSSLMHLSTKELQDMRKKMTQHLSNGN